MKRSPSSKGRSPSSKARSLKSTLECLKIQIPTRAGKCRVLVKSYGSGSRKRYLTPQQPKAQESGKNPPQEPLKPVANPPNCSCNPYLDLRKIAEYAAKKKPVPRPEVPFTVYSYETRVVLERLAERRRKQQVCDNFSFLINYL